VTGAAEVWGGWVGGLATTAQHAWLVTGIHSSGEKSRAYGAVVLAGERAEEANIFADWDAVRMDWGVGREVEESSQDVKIFRRTAAGVFGNPNARRWSGQRFGVQTGAEFDADAALKVRCRWQAKASPRTAFQEAVKDCLAIAAAEVGGVQSGKKGGSKLERAAGACPDDKPVAAMKNHWGCMPSGEAEVEPGRSHHRVVAERVMASRCPLARSKTPV